MQRCGGRARGRPLLPRPVLVLRPRAARPAPAARRAARQSAAERQPPPSSVARLITAARKRSMLQQMSSPSCSVLGDVATALRPLEGRMCGDASSEASSDAAEEFELPQCKIRRNYNCLKCKFFTQNPRAFLVHTRDVHFERFKIYDCPSCVYASRHHQKLIRHMKMVHGANGTMVAATKMELEPPAPVEVVEPPAPKKIEDMLEEIEDTNDIQTDVDEFNDDMIERSAETESENNRSITAETAPSRGRKDKFFSCNKCNYVTHIRSRFTKHVKYHSMPMIKCTVCDFRTPYKWNLDRHMKNHGGTGSFNCSMCNFTADIKQSLTVHEMNHHTSSPAGHSAVSRRRNRVGASDALLVDEAARAHEDGSGDSRSPQSADMGVNHADIEMVSCNSDSNDESQMEASDKPEDYQTTNDTHNVDLEIQIDTAKSKKETKKPPRPIPQLIPLNSSTPSQIKTSSITGEPPLKKIKEMLNNVSDNTESNNAVFENLPSDITLIPVNNQSVTLKDPPARKKNESFFDKLKERLLTETAENGLVCKNCGFKSKCLSEHSVHEKNCTPQSSRLISNPTISSLGSTRCQNCRHRCKSSADLYVHMKTCAKNAVKEVQTKEVSQHNELLHNQSGEAQPHPMENVVFVWNNIHHDSENKFESPLDIKINEDSTLPDSSKHYDNENSEENESMNLSPTQAIGKKVFKCPHCPFWASTASRFHVHIVGHLNKKPFECSLCKYKSNWRWDITKHIKLKSARDPDHHAAKVLMTDETGRRNYSKYNKFLAMPVQNECGENEFHYVDQEAATLDEGDVEEPFVDITESVGNPQDAQPLDLQTQHGDSNGKKSKRTLWKCKKCNYKDPSKEALLEHVREHSRPHDQDDQKTTNKKAEANKDPGDLAYRCGHCYQLSNWKHVIQRHCRLKHDGVIKVIAIEKPKLDEAQLSLNELNGDCCNKCPFKSSDKQQMLHHLQQHTPSPQSVFKCYFCPFFVKNENELPQHLVLHGVTDPEEYISKVMAGAKSPSANQQTSTKRHKCNDCPYETNSKSQYMYHEQFHRISSDTPYKCPECNYSVSKRHLLHQHLRVHMIFSKKNDAESESEASTSQAFMTDEKSNDCINLQDIRYVWVAAKNEFHKMFKCRYCSYVNSQKCKIPNHEKIHFIVSENGEVTGYKCWECKFTSDAATRLAAHSKLHGALYGRIYCDVEADVPDEEQIAKLRKFIEDDKIAIMEGLANEDPTSHFNEEGKMLYFCQKCPTRFLNEGELKIHYRLHEVTFLYKCKSCEFSVPNENQLSSHNFVHSDEYQNKTKMLKMVHDVHPDHKEPKLEILDRSDITEVIWVVSTVQHSEIKVSHNKAYDTNRHTPKQYHCKECPAKFFKTSTLNYHLGLHGGDGEHKCKKCSYAVKNVGHLAKHELLHENEAKTPTCNYESGDDIDYKNIPISGTDLFQRKTEAQKRVLLDKDKLVKPNDHFPPVLQADPQFGYLMHGNPEFIYPTYLKNGRQKEKRYKCHKCPSAFEKREQYKIHLSLHGSKQRYKCELCDYSVKYYANYVQHMRKHQMNDEALAERNKESNELLDINTKEQSVEESTDNIKLAIKTMPKGVPKSDFQQFSISDQQTLRILQRRRSINNSKDTSMSDSPPAKDRKLHLCTFCPYSNQRQDALENHYKRHLKDDSLNASSHICMFCNLSVVQNHFLREHLKTHFNHQKNLIPQCFAASEGVSLVITKLDDDNESMCIDLETDKTKIFNCEEDKTFVHTATGEIVVS